MNWAKLSEKLTDTCISAFAEEVEIHYLNVDSTYDVVIAKGVFDATYEQIDVQTGAVISSNAPMIEISTRFYSQKITTRDKIKVRSVLYRIKELQPDDSGALKILLARS